MSPEELARDSAAIETLAIRVAELLAVRLPPQPPQRATPGRLLSAAQVSEWWGVSRGWVYQHAAQLGAVRIGDGERPRLRFDPDRVAEHLNRPPATPPPTAQRTPRRVRRSPRIRGASRRLAFQADPELSSLHVNRRGPGDAPTSPAAAPKRTPSTRRAAYPHHTAG